MVYEERNTSLVVQGEELLLRFFKFGIHIFRFTRYSKLRGGEEETKDMEYTVLLIKVMRPATPSSHL